MIFILGWLIPSILLLSIVIFLSVQHALTHETTIADVGIFLLLAAGCFIPILNLTIVVAVLFDWATKLVIAGTVQIGKAKFWNKKLFGPFKEPKVDKRYETLFIEIPPPKDL